MNQNQIQKNEFELQKHNETYKNIDLTYAELNLDSVNFYIAKYNDHPYRTFCTFDTHVNHVFDEGVDRICCIFGYPFDTKIKIDNSMLKKCVDVELWFDYDRVRKNPERVFKELRRLTLQCHSEGVRVRAVTELKDIGLERTNQWLDVCIAASVNHIQTGYGLTNLNEEWLPEMKQKLKKLKIKAVGDINDIETAKNLLSKGADIIGSSTI